jgi:hypothetical protein
LSSIFSRKCTIGLIDIRTVAKEPLGFGVPVCYTVPFKSKKMEIKNFCLSPTISVDHNFFGHTVEYIGLEFFSLTVWAIWVSIETEFYAGFKNINFL